ncbi:protein-disulfide reductase DsbD [Nitrogeniibacter aestuarii]|uniref:protein-disulfide reductase DsbD n=1 Tax=Nitrogeniibacter aestuarii TaxID=2815343 RepID=UPI001D10B8AA|nr:protein-disulfide reductase DsbD [Nitrogeniibacter aestuarii]
MTRRFPLLGLLLLVFLTLLRPAFAAPELLPPDKAYRASVVTRAPDRVEVRFEIEDGYYLYKKQFQFRTEPESVVVGPAELPPGKVKQDEFFGEVETYRHELVFNLPVKAPADVTQFELTVISQGCADIGVCYPPHPQTLMVDLTRSEAPKGGFLSSLGIGGDDARPAMDTTPAKAEQPAPAPVAPASTDDGDESGRIAGLLSNQSLPLVLLSFFGFGLLLAFTPCTFPMIPILSGIIVGHGHKITRMRAFELSLAYVLGMAVTYAAAGVAAGLSGALLSAALQNVWVLSAFALLFVVLSLSMFGFYELQLPTALQSKLSDTASHEKGGSLHGVVVMGVLSALIVGPCVAAPLAGALLYIAKTGDAVLGGSALFVMALGMGAPLLAVGVAARSVLPKAGPWMEGVKRAFGVILLALAIWMISPVVPAVVPMIGYGVLLVFSGIYLHALDPLPQHVRNWQRFWKAVGVIALILGATLLVGAMAGSRDPLQPLAGLGGGAAVAAPAPVFEKVRSVAELDARVAASTRPVMLDFYADWCVSCKEMERFTFSDPTVQARMNQMLLLKADVTANNEDDQALLKRFDLFGPPGIIFFRPGGEEINGRRVVGYMPAEAFATQLDAVLRR